MFNAYTDRRLADEARAERIEELAKDPAKGGTVEDKTRREAEVALQLEEIGLLAGPIRRDPTGDAEFIDRRSTLWDVKQFHSELGRFNLGEAVKTIRKEILAGENVILDTKFLDPNDAALFAVPLRQMDGKAKFFGLRTSKGDAHVWLHHPA